MTIPVGATKSLMTRFEIKEIDEGGHTFTGLASTWDLDLGGDVIEPGAFKRTLKNWKGAKRHVPLIDSHNVWGTVTSVIGQMDDGVEVDEGLDGTFSMLSEDPTADAVFKRIQKRLVDGLSIGYEAVEVRYPDTDEERQKGIYRYLGEVKLREISVVLMPMNPNARIDLSTAKALLMAAKGRDLADEEAKELEAIQRQIGDLLAARLGSKEDDVPSPKEVVADPKAAEDLARKIDRLYATGLATRIEAAQHSGRAVLTGL